MPLGTIKTNFIGISELDGIAEERLEDGKKLLNAGRFDGANCVCGYAVEVGLSQLAY